VEFVGYEIHFGYLNVGTSHWHGSQRLRQTSKLKMYTLLKAFSAYDAREKHMFKPIPNRLFLTSLI
ncbi:hypothetical protein N9M08_00635, partial [Porticoccaceae bacterium]|nr:hypothetical protein [Porticoccaceae bacterium]